MQLPPSRRRVRLAPVAFTMAFGLALTACGLGKDDTSPDADSSSAAPVVDCASHGQVLGSGSTAQNAAMDMWIKNYQSACPQVQVAYRSLGSGSGVAQFVRGATAFGGSDGALTPEQVGWSRAACRAGKGIDLPLVGGPIALGYNLSGIKHLVLDAPVLAKIFDARITRWDDAAIRKLNPGVTLPPTPIVPIHRSDDSGTTQNLNLYLATAAPREWKYPAGKSFPGRGGQSANGSDGVAGQVKGTDGGIGYFELSYAEANKLTTVSIDTGAKRPVDVSVASASAGIAAAKVSGNGMDLSLNLDYATQAEGAYPIVLVTYELVCDRGNAAATLPALKSFLSYAAGTDGQKLLAGAYYAPLPPNIAERVRAVIPTLS